MVRRRRKHVWGEDVRALQAGQRFPEQPGPPGLRRQGEEGEEAARRRSCLVFLLLYKADFSSLSPPGLVAGVRIKGSRRRSWCSRTRRPAGCGCAPARTPPPKSWCWTPLSRRTCSTASTPATPTWFASRVCQVGRTLQHPFVFSLS